MVVWGEEGGGEETERGVMRWETTGGLFIFDF